MLKVSGLRLELQVVLGVLNETKIVPGLHVRMKVDCTERSSRSLMDTMDAARATSCQQPMCTGARLDIVRPPLRGLAHTLSLSRASVPSAHACPFTTCAQAAPLFAPPFPPPSVALRLCWWGSLLPAPPILSSALSNSSRLLHFHGPRRSGESPSLADVVTQTPRCDTLLMHGHSARSAPYVLSFTCLRLSLAVHSFPASAPQQHDHRSLYRYPTPACGRLDIYTCLASLSQYAPRRRPLLGTKSHCRSLLTLKISFGIHSCNAMVARYIWHPTSRHPGYLCGLVHVGEEISRR